MDETLSARSISRMAQPLSPPGHHAETDPYGKLLADIECCSVTHGRSQIIATYQAWIRQDGVGSAMLFAAWFNLGGELAEAGDRVGAIEAYRHSLALRPGFGPAAANLGVLLESPAPSVALPAIPEPAWQTGQLNLASSEQTWSASVLHVGCGAEGREKLPPIFRNANWREIRLDIDPDVRPDFIASITDMHVIPDGLIDAVYSAHNIEHLYPHQVPLALREMHRVIKPDGFVHITLPDLQEVARHVADGRLEDTLYLSTMGPIAPLDILFGHRTSLEQGNAFMAHHTGFTGGTLGDALIKAGFAAVVVQRHMFALTAIAFRSTPGEADLLKAQLQLVADCPAVLYTPAA